MTRKQCSGMHCVKSEKNRAKPTDEQRNVGKRPEPVREPVSKVSISLGSSLRHRSASSFNVTLRDDGSRGEWRRSLQWDMLKLFSTTVSSVLFPLSHSVLRHQRWTSYWRNLLGCNGNWDLAEQSPSPPTAGWLRSGGVATGHVLSCNSIHSCTIIERQRAVCSHVGFRSEPCSKQESKHGTSKLKNMHIVNTSYCRVEILTLHFEFFGSFYQAVSLSLPELQASPLYAAPSVQVQTASLKYICTICI